MDSGMNSRVAAAANCSMKDIIEKVDRDHNSAMITHTGFSSPPLYLMLQLAAAAPGLFMPLSFMLLTMIHIRILVKIVLIIVKVPTGSE